MVTSVVCGIDPGLGRCGYAFVSTAPPGEATAPLGKGQLLALGTIVTAPSDPLPARLGELYAQLRDLETLYRAQIWAVEQMPPGSTRTRAAGLQMGLQARGVAVLAATQRAAAVWEPLPQTWRGAVLGQPRATKRETRALLRPYLGTRPASDDAVDALGIALWAADAAQSE